MLIYAVIAGLLVTVVVNLSKTYLSRRSLVAAADGAALTAANQPDLARIYAGAGPILPLSEPGARAAVAQYATDAELSARFDGFRVVSVTTDGRTVTVRLRAVVRMPFANVLTAGLADGYEVTATAHATSPLVP